ncbi:Peptidyl-prolyl cis-trans isomerase D [Ferriphaselus amnicola]|uniref:Periplasmic chaperone PpiD n=1 Tax=Ferriphaselus amnicola TaxID=1188319 RepID=A0A2Z6GDJ5_9PROT|nr:SurA N-terminal domain-containing protein [Ferriphaselus amnicola]BBE51693.1 Peptidyl-prolyl cis-trans isomerase D [Ferriphaselus amnicola]
MFDFVQEKRRLVQIVLGLIVLPFAFWGVDSYQKSSGGDYLAKVDGVKISPQEFDNALRQQQDKVREMTGGDVDPAMFDKVEVKQSILESLISQKLLLSQARSAGLAVTDEQLAQVIAGIPAFSTDGKFDQKRYESLLASQNMTPVTFEARVREELSVRQLTDPYTQSGYASVAAAENLIHLAEQQRTISVATLSPAAYQAQVKVDDTAVQAYYDKNQNEFQAPEQARVEFLAFSAGALQGQVEVDEAESKKYYDEHQAEFGAPEQRQAAHILISVSPQSSAAEKEAAKAKAENVLAQVRQNPSKFAELAKQNSQDLGSAVNGGDLGVFGRGAMVKPFEEATFALKAGEISGLVQSDFGYHIIKLLAVKPARIASLAEVKGAIDLKLRQQKAADKFAELAEKFSNAVYEQSDSLKAAADLVKLPVQQSGWLVKGQTPAAPWTDRALQAVFSDDVVKNKRNTAAVEIGPNTLLAARLVEHKPASVRPLVEVAAAIRQKLQFQQAMELANKQGKDNLAQLQKGATPEVSWQAAQVVTRARHPGLEGDLARQLFQANTSKLPLYLGAETAQGYLLLRLEAVKEGAEIDDAKRSAYMQQLRQFSGEELMRAYLADARKHADVSIKPFAEAEKK